MSKSVTSQDYIELAADIVSAYVSNNSVPAADLPTLLQSVYTALTKTAHGQEEEPKAELMPAVSVRKSLTPDAPLTPVPSEILDQFVRQGPISHEELDAAVRRFKKAIIERALGGELTHHLGYPPGGIKPEDTTNHRNGTGGKSHRNQ